MATRRVKAKKHRNGKKTTRARRSRQGRKTRRVRRSGRGGVSQADIFSALLDLKRIQDSVRVNINDFVTKEMRRIKRPTLKVLEKFDTNSGDVANVFKKHREQVKKEYDDAESMMQRTVLARMPSGEHTSQRGDDGEEAKR
jgi:hypothetical protein